MTVTNCFFFCFQIFKIESLKMHFLFPLQSNRGYDPTFCVMDECGYMHHSAVASALTYATNRGVTIMLLCSPVEASHWLSKLDNIMDGDKKGVNVISLRYLCDACSKKGETGVCVHGFLKLPWHIEAGGDVSEDPVRQVMDLVVPGAYQQEICGFNEHTKERETEVFGQESLQRLLRSNCISLSLEDQKAAEALYMCLDPVQAGSSVSGIGLAIVLEVGETYTVSIFSFFSQQCPSFSRNKKCMRRACKRRQLTNNLWWFVAPRCLNRHVYAPFYWNN